MIERSKISTEAWEKLHECYLNGYAAVPNRDLAALLPEIGKLILVGETDRDGTKITLSNKEGLRSFLVCYPNQLEKVLRSWQYTLQNLKAIISFLEELKEFRELPYSRKPKSKWLDEILQDRFSDEAEIVRKRRGQCIVLYKDKRADYFIAFCQRRLKIGKSMRELIEKAKLSRKHIKDAAKMKLKEGLTKVRQLDSSLATKLQEALIELVRENE